MRKAFIFILTVFLSIVPAFAQNTSGATKASIANSILLLRSQIGSNTKNGTAFVVQTNSDSCLAVTSYEAIKGASSINAYIPGKGLEMVHLLSFAPEANMALLQLSVTDIPALKLGDSDMLKPDDAIEMTSAIGIIENGTVSAMDCVTRSGKLQNIIPRPTGTVLRLNFSPGITDESSGAPIINPATGDVVGIALSLEASSGVDTLRFAIPINLVGALNPDLVKTGDDLGAIKILDGSEAPVLTDDNPEGEGDKSGGDSLGFIITIVVALAVVGGFAFFYLRKGGSSKVVPFSIFPQLPEGVNVAFVDAEGHLLPMDSDVITVGRSEDNTWVFSDQTVSRHHADITRIKGSNNFEIKDVRSTYGTFVRNRRIAGSETIMPGNIVKFGKKVEVMLMTRAHSNQ